MNIPPGYTEQQIINTINSVVNQLAKQFRFGYHDHEDMLQQGRIFALEFLNSGKYDSNRNLFNILYSHVRNRFINFKRDNYERLQSPCFTCPFYDPKLLKSTNECSAFEDKNECGKWSGWFQRNSAKKNLSRPCNVSSIAGTGLSQEECFGNYITHLDIAIDKNEVLSRLDRVIPPDLRGDYCRLKDGVNLPKNRRDKLTSFILNFLENESIPT